MRWTIALSIGLCLYSTWLHGKEPTKPRLILLLTIDQARGEYLERFRPVLTGGLSSLLSEGVVFTNAHHNHATTTTGPGHASLSTGLYPSHSGIVDNSWFERRNKQHVYCVEDNSSPLLELDLRTGRTSRGPASKGRSPINLLDTGFGDWLKAAYPNARVYSIGGKDRSAVLMGGKNNNGTYWYSLGSGRWVSSSHYLQHYPEWVLLFHRRQRVEDYLGKPWLPMSVEEATLNRIDIVPGPYGTFPHYLGSGQVEANSSFYREFYNSPFLDTYLFDFAKALIEAEKLGKDDIPDVLALSFASVDTVGHTYGPNSHELLDTMMRLDRELDKFFRFLDKAVKLEHVGMLLSGDHGVAPMPEYQKLKGLPGRRLSSHDYECIQKAQQAILEQFGQDHWFLYERHFNYKTLDRNNIKRTHFENVHAQALERCKAVTNVWTRTEMETQSGRSENPVWERYINSYFPDRSPDFYVQLEKWQISTRLGTTHGSVYDYDSHVPAVIRWPGITARRRVERINTVDLPITLAALTGISVPGPRDGVDRSATWTH